MKRIVLFAEGEGEQAALPKLVKRILTEQGAWERGGILLDESPFRVGHVGNVVKDDCSTMRDAKGWIKKVLEGGYRPTRDQAALTELADLQAIRNRNLRSFRRLEAALAELVSAIRQGVHVATPIRQR